MNTRSHGKDTLQGCVERPAGVRSSGVRSAGVPLDRVLCAVVPCVVVLLFAGACSKPEVSYEPSGFLRFVTHAAGEDGATPREATLETAIVTYRNARGAEVSLVAAVHVGDARYYAELESFFAGQDRVLYELIAAPGSVPVPGERSTGGISFVQRMIQNLLELEFQLDAIDYTRDSFVHADMDPGSFRRAQRARGESIFSLMWQVMLSEMQRMQAGEETLQQMTLTELYTAFMSADRARSLKLLLGSQFESMERVMSGIDQGGEGSVIVTERNRVAIAVLKRRLRKGDRKLAIFYGAAHMADFEERLIRRLGFEKVGERRLVAWDMRADAGN